LFQAAEKVWNKHYAKNQPYRHLLPGQQTSILKGLKKLRRKPFHVCGGELSDVFFANDLKPF